jgi:hypothetical protein
MTSTLLFSLCFISILLFQNSIEQIATTDDPNRPQLTITENQMTTTSSWWRRTFPISRTTTPRTRPTRPIPRPPPPKTTRPPRVSSGVVISIPLLLLFLTLIAGFGAIIYGLRTGGNGMAILTRTTDHHNVV